jgi:hypothetical protein
MDRELEELILAYEAVREARSAIAHRRFLTRYESRLDDALQRRPGLSRDSLQKAIRVAHRKWIVAQSKPPTIPPTA